MTSQDGRELRNRELQPCKSLHDPIVPLRDCQRAAPNERSPHAALCLMLDRGGDMESGLALQTSSPHHLIAQEWGELTVQTERMAPQEHFSPLDSLQLCIKMTFFMPGMKFKKICKTFLTCPLDLTLIRARKKDVDMRLGVIFYSPWQPMGNRKGRLESTTQPSSPECIKMAP